MSKTKILITAASAVGVFVAWNFVSFAGSTFALYERFPNIDRKVVAKAHRIMCMNAYRGRYNQVDLTDEKCDEIFLDIVTDLTK